MGYDTFGLRIGVEGEKEFRNALRDINQSFKVLGSEMKLVSSEFDKNDRSVQAVAARHEVLNKAIDAQKEKIKHHVFLLLRMFLRFPFAAVGSQRLTQVSTRG